MRHRALGFLGAALLLCSAPAPAVQCSVDQVPAATLLVPFFEVDLTNFDRKTTIFWVTNTAPTATLAHVTIWTDWGVPSLVFDVYLTGYDVQPINLRDVIEFGNLPRTASVGQDPFNTISPQGPRSQDINIPSCNGVLPPSNPALSPAVRAELQAKLKGEPLPSNPALCAGSPRGNQIARGYVTVDVVTGCTLLNPSSAGYFSGVAGSANVLAGEVMIVDPSIDTMWGYPVVHLETVTLPPGAPSFYGRYVGDNGSDGREPLPSTYAARFLGPGPGRATQLLVWREAPSTPAPVSCASGPPWVPLATLPTQLLDEATQATAAAVDLPVATDLVDLETDVVNPFDNGLAILELGFGPFASRRAQAWVQNASTVANTLESTPMVTSLDNLCTGQVYQATLLKDGFENGFVPWSGKTP